MRRSYSVLLISVFALALLGMRISSAQENLLGAAGETVSNIVEGAAGAVTSVLDAPSDEQGGNADTVRDADQDAEAAASDTSVAAVADTVRELGDAASGLVDAATAIPVGTIGIVADGVPVPAGGMVKGAAVITVSSPVPVQSVTLRFLTLDPLDRKIVLTVNASAADPARTRFIFELPEGRIAPGPYQVVAYLTDAQYTGVPFARASVTLENSTERSADTARNTEAKDSATSTVRNAEGSGTATSSVVADARNINDSRIATSTGSSSNMAVAVEDRATLLRLKYDALAECKSRNACRTLCFAEENTARCRAFLTDITATGTIDALRERIGARAVIDADADGITDYDERALYRTDPNEADTDGDGTPDGDELLRLTSPLAKPNDTRTQASSTATSTGGTTPEQALTRISFQDPHEAGAEVPELLSTDNIILRATTTAQGTSTRLVFSGKGLPDSFVTVFIFSTPIIATVKAGPDGEWQIELEKELEDGPHEVYAAFTDAAGKILAKSTLLPFVKTAHAVTLGAEEIDPLALPAIPPPAERFARGSLLLLSGIGGGLLVLIIGILGFMRFRRRVHEGDGDSTHRTDDPNVVDLSRK